MTTGKMTEKGVLLGSQNSGQPIAQSAEMSGVKIVGDRAEPDFDDEFEDNYDEDYEI